jgi:hypothetical protein
MWRDRKPIDSRRREWRIRVSYTAIKSVASMIRFSIAGVALAREGQDIHPESKALPASPPPVPEPVASSGDTSFSGASPLDIARYREHLKGLDLSEAQASELLETLQSILSAFVDGQVPSLL